MYLARARRRIVGGSTIMKITNKMYRELDPSHFDKEQIETFRNQLENEETISPSRESILNQLYFLLEAWENYQHMVDMNLDTSYAEQQLEEEYKDLIDLVKSYTLPAPAA